MTVNNKQEELNKIINKPSDVAVTEYLDNNNIKYDVVSPHGNWLESWAITALRARREYLEQAGEDEFELEELKAINKILQYYD